MVYYFFWNDSFIWPFFLLLPFNAFLLIYILQISALIFSLLFLTVIKLIHRPREGIFKRDIKDKEYKYWNLRNAIKKWPLYITASNPFPWLKNRFMLRFFGVKIGSKTICDNSWISSEFVSIGKNVIMGMSSTAISFGIEQDSYARRAVSSSHYSRKVFKKQTWRNPFRGRSKSGPRGLDSLLAPLAKSKRSLSVITDYLDFI